MNCKSCIFLSKDKSHLIDYLKNLPEDDSFFTCKAPDNKFKEEWSFVPVNDSVCGGHYYQPKAKQLNLFEV